MAVVGRALFERDWVPAPASTDSADGLGPLFAARSCSGCHAGPALAARFTSRPGKPVAGRGLVVRFGDPEGRPDPLYGTLLQNQAVQGMRPEGRVVITAADPESGPLEVAVMLDRGPLDPGTRQSVRIAPPLAGRAILDWIDPASVLARADPATATVTAFPAAPGCSMLAGRRRSAATAGRRAPSRSTSRSLTPLLSISACRAHGARSPMATAREAEEDCLAAPSGESARHSGHELSDEMIRIVAAYLQSLPAPKRTGTPSAGSELFASTGCAACHAPSIPGPDGTEMTAYTDLLLHDMGPDLDDGVGAPGVASAEWRTAPLIAVSGGAGRRYLHDGRAPDLDAAIRAHGGEGKGARTRYLALSDPERQALTDFVGSL